MAIVDTLTSLPHPPCGYLATGLSCLVILWSYFGFRSRLPTTTGVDCDTDVSCNSPNQDVATIGSRVMERLAASQHSHSDDCIALLTEEQGDSSIIKRFMFHFNVDVYGLMSSIIDV